MFPRTRVVLNHGAASHTGRGSTGRPHSRPHSRSAARCGVSWPPFAVVYRWAAAAAKPASEGVDGDLRRLVLSRICRVSRSAFSFALRIITERIPAHAGRQGADWTGESGNGISLGRSKNNFLWTAKPVLDSGSYL